MGLTTAAVGFSRSTWTFFGMAIDKMPEDWRARRGKARGHAEGKDWDRAIAECTAAIA